MSGRGSQERIQSFWTSRAAQEEDDRRYRMTKDKRKRRNKKASVDKIDFHQTTQAWLADRLSLAVTRLR